MDGTRNCRGKPTPEEFLERMCKQSLTHRRLKKGPFPVHALSRSLLDISVIILNLAAAIPFDHFAFFYNQNHTLPAFSIRDFSVLFLFLSLLTASRALLWFEKEEVLLLLPKQPCPHKTWNAMGLANTPQLI